MMENRLAYNTQALTTPYQNDWNHCLELVGSQRDKAAFKALFEHFAPLLKGFLLKSGGVDAEQIEELVQETMIKVWNKGHAYSSAHAAASTWIFTIARNTRVDWLRKQNRENPLCLSADDIYDDADTPTPFSSLTQLRNSRHIQRHLNKLPEDQKQVVTLMYYKGKSGQEVAEELALPLGTVKSRIRLALAKLRVGLTPDYKNKEELA